MKKIFTLVALSGLAAVSGGVDGAMAQTTQSAVVGNPDSANVLIMEEGYEVVAPAADSVNSASPQSPDWSQEGNVEVAPIPTTEQSAPTAGDNNNAAVGNAGTTASRSAADSATITVDESVMEVATPDSAAVEMNTTISN